MAGPPFQGLEVSCQLVRGRPELLSLRQSDVVPLDCGPGKYRMLGEHALEVTWGKLLLIANCGDEEIAVKHAPKHKPLWTNGPAGAPWSVNWWIKQ